MKTLLITGLFFLCCNLFAQDISSFPYSTGFEGMEGTLNENFPSNWSSEDLNSIEFGNQGWQIIKNTPLSQNAHTDSTAVHMFSHPSEANDDWLYTPSVQMQAGNTYHLSFWMRISSIGGSSEKLKIHVSETNDAASMEMNDPIWSNDMISNESYELQELSFTATEDGNYYFGFHCYSDAFQFILLLDDVTIDESLPQGITHPKGESGTTISIYPNPTSGEFKFQVNELGLTYTIVDMNGRKIRSGKTESLIQPIDISNEAPGVYILKMIGEEFSSEKRILKE